MRVVATEAGDAPRVHEAVNEVVALHPILVRSPVGEMGERRLAELVIFQFPKIVQALAHVEAHGPVIGVSDTGRDQTLPLRMALYARVSCVNIVQARRVYYIPRCWLLHVVAAGTMALFATNIPFSHRFCGHIIVDGMAAVAGRPGGAVH